MSDVLEVSTPELDLDPFSDEFLSEPYRLHEIMTCRAADAIWDPGLRSIRRHTFDFVGLADILLVGRRGDH